MSIRRVVPAFSLMLFVLLFTGRALAVCGDGMCRWQEAENCEVCPVDCRCAPGEICSNAMCRSVGGCGDGQCAPQLGENCENCAMDCRCAPGELCRYAQCTRVGGCGDGHCAPHEGENCETCAIDCRCAPNARCIGGECRDAGHCPGGRCEESVLMQPGHPPEVDFVGPAGWCCRESQVFEDRLRPCENSGGVLFLSHEEAQGHCAGQWGSSPGSRPGEPHEATPITLPAPRGVQQPYSPGEPGDRRKRGHLPPTPAVLPIPVPGPRDHRPAPPPEVLPIPLPEPRIPGAQPRPEMVPVPHPGPREWHGDRPHPEINPLPLPMPAPQEYREMRPQHAPEALPQY